ncbi:hypothetical protein P0845_004299 [Salmonella enterica]|nr:hypothetical protein [Salmonella enterica]
MAFLNSPLGVLCLAIMAAVSLINIYAHWIEDGFVGRLLYMATALTCAAGMAKFTNSSMPEHLAATLIVLQTATGVRDVCHRLILRLKYRRTIHAKKHQ